MKQVFEDSIIQAHLRPFQHRHSCPHIAIDGGNLESVADREGVAVELQHTYQLLAALAKTDDEIGVGLAPSLDVYAATHTHDGVERGAHGAAQVLSRLDDFGMLGAVAATEELLFVPRLALALTSRQ